MLLLPLHPKIACELNETSGPLEWNIIFYGFDFGFLVFCFFKCASWGRSIKLSSCCFWAKQRSERQKIDDLSALISTPLTWWLPLAGDAKHTRKHIKVQMLDERKKHQISQKSEDWFALVRAQTCTRAYIGRVCLWTCCLMGCDTIYWTCHFFSFTWVTSNLIPKSQLTECGSKLLLRLCFLFYFSLLYFPLSPSVWLGTRGEGGSNRVKVGIFVFVFSFVFFSSTPWPVCFSLNGIQNPHHSYASSFTSSLPSPALYLILWLPLSSDGRELCLYPAESVLPLGRRDLPRPAGGTGGAGRLALRRQRAGRWKLRLLGQEEEEKEGTWPGGWDF